MTCLELRKKLNKNCKSKQLNLLLILKLAKDKMHGKNDKSTQKNLHTSSFQEFIFTYWYGL